MLISAMLGINSRTTMDMDTTIKGFELTEENVNKILKEICEIDIDDNVKISLTKIEEIRENDTYKGYRATFEANYNNELPVIMKIDITTGDQITYKEIDYSINLLLENKKIHVWSYNLETIIAEKFETIISRNISTTRIRDYYDAYMLVNLYYDKIDKSVLRDAIALTSKHRESEEKINDAKSIINEIEKDEDLVSMWKKYQKQNFYAKNISFESLIQALNKILEIYNF